MPIVTVVVKAECVDCKLQYTVAGILERESFLYEFFSSRKKNKQYMEVTMIEPVMTSDTPLIVAGDRLVTITFAPEIITLLLIK